jgi:hypothetical protein
MPPPLYHVIPKISAYPAQNIREARKYLLITNQLDAIKLMETYGADGVRVGLLLSAAASCF